MHVKHRWRKRWWWWSHQLKQKKKKKRHESTGRSDPPSPPRSLVSLVWPIRIPITADHSPSCGAVPGHCLYVHRCLLSCQKSEHGCGHGLHVNLTLRERKQHHSVSEKCFLIDIQKMHKSHDWMDSWLKLCISRRQKYSYTFFLTDLWSCVYAWFCFIFFLSLGKPAGVRKLHSQSHNYTEMEVETPGVSTLVPAPPLIGPRRMVK